MSETVKNLWRRVQSYLPWRHEDGSTAVAVRSNGSPPARAGRRGLETALDRIFDPAFDPWQDLVAAWPHTRWLAPVELQEDEEGYDVRVDVPGYGAHDLDVTVTGTNLTVRAERQERCGSSHREGRLFLTVPLPDEVDRDRAQADTRDGVLHVRLPKSERARSRVRRIVVNA